MAWLILGQEAGMNQGQSRRDRGSTRRARKFSQGTLDAAPGIRDIKRWDFALARCSGLAMPSRRTALVILVFWLATSGWLIYREFWPRFYADEPPPFAVQLV